MFYLPFCVTVSTTTKKRPVTENMYCFVTVKIPLSKCELLCHFSKVCFFIVSIVRARTTISARAQNLFSSSLSVFPNTATYNLLRAISIASTGFILMSFFEGIPQAEQGILWHARGAISGSHGVHLQLRT